MTGEKSSMKVNKHSFYHMIPVLYYKFKIGLFQKY